MNNSKVVVIGVGNLLLGDEGVGIHIIRELENLELPPQVEVYDGGTGGLKLLDLMYGAKRALFIDAVDIRKEPGTVTIFKSEDVRSLYQKKRYSLHDTDLLEVIKMVELFDNPPEIEIIGVQPKIINYGDTLSKELTGSMLTILNAVLNRIKAYSHTV